MGSVKIPIKKLMFLAAWVWGILVFGYGFIKYPTAPYSLTEAGYQDKKGTPVSGAAFEKFKVWETTLVVSWGSMMVLGIAIFGIPRRGSGADLRGNSVPSPDGKSYLVIDDNTAETWGPISVDERTWPYPLHTPGLIEPGVHKIQCGNGRGTKFEINAAHTFHINSWGP